MHGLTEALGGALGDPTLHVHGVVCSATSAYRVALEKWPDNTLLLRSFARFLEVGARGSRLVALHQCTQIQILHCSTSPHTHTAPPTPLLETLLMCACLQDVKHSPARAQYCLARADALDGKAGEEAREAAFLAESQG